MLVSNFYFKTSVAKQVIQISLFKIFIIVINMFHIFKCYSSQSMKKLIIQKYDLQIIIQRNLFEWTLCKII